MQAERRFLEPTAAETYDAVRREILPRLGDVAACRSTTELRGNPAYLAIEAAVEEALATPHACDFRGGAPRARHGYRFVAWNIERGTHLEAQIRALKMHPQLSEADVLLITEADAGMARSGNRMVAETMARELGMTQVFAPCYIALGKGSGVERDVDGVNEFGLHGNALLSRYPMRDVRVIPLVNGIDKMAHREKRLGRQAAIAAVIEFPNMEVEAVCVHLDAQATQRHRARQMESILAELRGDLPAVIGGDWNTSTYNSSRARGAILGYCVRVAMGVDNVIRNHYLHPERLFERGLFRMLEQRGFEFRKSNVEGEYTTYTDVNDPRTFRNLGEWVPAWCFHFIRWALRNHGGRCPMKLDWFATRGVSVRRPGVVHDLRLSDHDPIVVEIGRA